MSTYHSAAVVLKRQDFKEYDKLLTVYTEKAGKMEVVARGVKKIQSKLAGHLEPFNVIDLVLAKGKYRDKVTGSSIVDNFGGLNSQIEGIFLANYFNECVDLLTRVHQPDQNTFDLIKLTYQSIDGYLQKNGNGDFQRQYLIILSFLLQLLSLQGFQPVFGRCFHCEKELKEENNSISYSHLSVVCPSCRKEEDNLESISATALKVIRFMNNKEFPTLKITNLNNTVFWEIQEKINKLLMAVSEKEIKSVRIIQSLIKR